MALMSLPFDSIIMGLDRNNKLDTLLSNCSPVSRAEKTFPLYLQDPLWLCLRRILPAHRSSGLDALHLGNQAGRADNPV